MIEVGDTVRSNDEAFECPFCTKKFFIAEDDKGPVGIIHEVPYCKEFAKSPGPGEFLRLVNDHAEQKG